MRMKMSTEFHAHKNKWVYVYYVCSWKWRASF